MTAGRSGFFEVARPISGDLAVFAFVQVARAVRPATHTWDYFSLLLHGVKT